MTSIDVQARRVSAIRPDGQELIIDYDSLRFSGFRGWVIWAFVHLTFLTGFGNRILAAFRWSYGLVGRRRSERTITVRQATARIRELGEIPLNEDRGARTGNSR